MDRLARGRATTVLAAALACVLPHGFARFADKAASSRGAAYERQAIGRSVSLMLRAYSSVAVFSPRREGTGYDLPCWRRKKCRVAKCETCFPMIAPLCVELR